MVRRMLIAAATLVLVGMPIRAQSDPADVEKIKAMETQWADAMVRGEWVTIEKMIAPGFLGTDGTGKRYTKAEYMSMMKTGGMSFSDMQPGPSNVIVSGNTAVHTGEATVTVKMPDGTTNRIHSVWTDTWVKGKNGKWLCIAGQWVDHPAT
jgi:ketosteroid isomerase-like protein